MNGSGDPVQQELNGRLAKIDAKRAVKYLNSLHLKKQNSSKT
jgi:hypothetical protein